MQADVHGVGIPHLYHSGHRCLDALLHVAVGGPGPEVDVGLHDQVTIAAVPGQVRSGAVNRPLVAMEVLRVLLVEIDQHREPLALPVAVGDAEPALQAHPVVIGVIEEDKDGNQILPFTEDNPGGGSAASTSIYVCRFGLAEYVSGLQAGNMDVLDQGLSGTFYQTLIEWICGLGVFHPKAAARLRGIKNA